MKLDVYTRKIHWKIALIAFGTIIGLASLFYTESFLKELRAEEELKIKRWAEAVEAVFFAEDDVNLSFYTQIIQDNKTNQANNVIISQFSTTTMLSPNGSDTPAKYIGFHIRQNASGYSDGNIAVKSYEVFDITDVVLAWGGT